MKTGNAVLNLLAARFTARLNAFGKNVQGSLLADPRQIRAVMVEEEEKTREDKRLVDWAEATQFGFYERKVPSQK